MSPKPAIILHNALLREFYMACDRSCEIWGVRIWHPLISDRQLLKQTLKWAISPPPSAPLSLLSLAAKIGNIKGSESPSAFKRRVKCSTFSVRFWKWSHLKAICLHRSLTCHRYRELSFHGASADGDRHPSSDAFTKTRLDVLQACWTVCFT